MDNIAGLKQRMMARSINLSNPLWYVQLLVIAFLAFFILYPIAILFKESIYSTTEGFTFKWYLEAYTDARSLKAIRDTLFVALSSGILATVIGTFIAWVSARTNTPFKRTIGVAAIIPFIMPPFIGGLAWTLLASPQAGLLNQMDAFTKQTGIPAQFWRSGAMKVIQKFEAEVEARRVMTNLVSVAHVGAALRWSKNGLMEPYDSPVAGHFADRYKIGNYMIVQKLMTAVIVYNTRLVKESDAPKHWSDVLDPKYKDMMVMHDARYSGSATHFMYGMRKLLGMDFIPRLAKNNIMLKRGGGATMNTIVAGERSIGIGVPEYHFFRQAKKGAPVRAIYPEEGTTALNFYLGIPKGAPDMDAAKKAFDFSLSREMQQLWQDKFGIPVARDDMPPFNDDFRKWGLKPFSELNTFASTLDDFLEEAATEKEMKKEYQLISG